MQALLAPPRQDLAEAEVSETLRMLHSPKIRHGVDVLDTDDNPTGETVPMDSDAGGEVTWSYRPPDGVSVDAGAATTDVAEVRRQATLVLTGDVTLNLIARRFRIWTEILSPGGTWIRFWLGVFVATLPPIEDDGGAIRRKLNLADKSFRLRRPIEDTVIVPDVTNVVQWVVDDLGDRFGETSFAIPASDVTLDVGRIFQADGKLTWLDVYNTLLQVAAYDQLTMDEAGHPASTPLAEIANRGIEATYGNDRAAGHKKIVVASTIEPLLPDLPNVIRFVARQGPSLAEEGNGIVTVTNQSTGPGSIDERGEEVYLRVDVDAEGQDELEAIAAAEAQRYFAGGGHRFTGKVVLNPLHSDRDVIGLVKPRIGVATAEAWCVTDWTYPLHRINQPDAVVMPIVCERRV